MFFAVFHKWIENQVLEALLKSKNPTNRKSTFGNITTGAIGTLPPIAHWLPPMNKP